MVKTNVNKTNKTNVLKYLSYQMFLMKKSIWFWILFTLSALLNIVVFLIIYFLTGGKNSVLLNFLVIFKTFSTISSIIYLIVFSTWIYGIINKSTRESNIDLLSFTHGMSRKVVYFSRFLAMLVLTSFMAFIYAITSSIITGAVNYYVGINNFLYFLSFILISWMIVVVLFPIFELTSYIVNWVILINIFSSSRFKQPIAIIIPS